MFEIFWREYPRKADKARAEKAFLARYRSTPRGKWEELTMGIARHLESYQDEIREKGTAEKYIKYPATWLRANDFFEPPTGGGNT